MPASSGVVPIWGNSSPLELSIAPSLEGGRMFETPALNTRTSPLSAVLAVTCIEIPAPCHSMRLSRETAHVPNIDRRIRHLSRSKCGVNSVHGGDVKDHRGRLEV